MLMITQKGERFEIGAIFDDGKPVFRPVIANDLDEVKRVLDHYFQDHDGMTDFLAPSEGVAGCPLCRDMDREVKQQGKTA